MTLPGFDTKKIATKIFKKRGGEEILKHQADIEGRLIDTANAQLPNSKQIEYLDEEERAKQLTDGIMAIIDGEILEFYAIQYGKYRCGMDNPEHLVRYVGMSDEEFSDQQNEWLEMQLDAGYADEDDTPVDAANRHIEAVFNVSQDEFYQELILDYDSKEGDILKRLLSGDSFEANYRIFTGLVTADEAINYAFNELIENE